MMMTVADKHLIFSDLKQKMDCVYEQLLNDLRNPKQQISVISMGIKAGGKSTKACALIRYCVEHDLFDEYFMFLPAFSKDIENSYGWTEQYKSKIVIFTEYNVLFAKYLLDRTPQEVARNKKGTLVFLDDIGCNSDFNSRDPHWFRLVGQQRHERVSTILNFHSLCSQRIISPFVRQNATYFLVFSLSNFKILRQLHEEILSCTVEYADFKPFFTRYKEHTRPVR